MAMYIVKIVTKQPGGMSYTYYALRETYWDSEKKTIRQRYLAGLGPSKRISIKRAQEICRKLDLTLDELRTIKGLRIEE